MQIENNMKRKCLLKRYVNNDGHNEAILMIEFLNEAVAIVGTTITVNGFQWIIDATR